MTMVLMFIASGALLAGQTDPAGRG